MTCAHALTLSLLTRICQSYIYTAYTRISSREITEYTVMYGVYMWLWPTLLLIPNSKFCVLQLRDMYSCSDTHSSHVLMLRHSLLTCTHAPTLTPHMYSLLTCTHAPTLTPHMYSCSDTHSSHVLTPHMFSCSDTHSSHVLTPHMYSCSDTPHMYSCSDTHSAHVLMLRHSLLPPLLHETRSRFCMLQLVGRPEMDKVQLQRETNTGNPNKVMVRGRI